MEERSKRDNPPGVILVTIDNRFTGEMLSNLNKPFNNRKYFEVHLGCELAKNSSKMALKYFSINLCFPQEI